MGNRNAIVTAENAKSGKARPLPLNDEAILILHECNMSCEYVFTVNGQRLTDIDRNDFVQATVRFAISDFRFYDLSRRWTSWHVQNGMPLVRLEGMGGWGTLEVVKKRAHLSVENSNKPVDSVTFLTQKNEAGIRQNTKNYSAL